MGLGRGHDRRRRGATEATRATCEALEGRALLAGSPAAAASLPDYVSEPLLAQDRYEFEAGTTERFSYGSFSGGGVPAGAKVGMYLSADTAWSGDDAFLGWASGWLPSVTFPSSTATGEYYLLSVADPANAVTESNETNNTAVGARVTVHATYGAPPPSYVPVFRDVQLSTSAPVIAGRTFPASVYMNGFDEFYHIPIQIGLSANEVAGDGDDVAVGSAVVTRFIPSGFYHAGPPEGRAYAEVTLPAGLAAGTYRLVGTAANATPFLGEVVEVEAIPEGRDLEFASDLQAVPTQLEGAAYHFASVAVLNRGSLDSGKFRVGYYWSVDATWDPGVDVLIGEGKPYPDGGLGPMDKEDHIGGGGIWVPNEAGVYYVIVVLDPDGQVAERDESDNVMAFGPVTVTFTPQDLSATWVRTVYSGSMAVAGGSLAVMPSVMVAGSPLSAMRVRYALSKDGVAGNADDIPLGTILHKIDTRGSQTWGDGSTFTLRAGRVAPGTYRLVIEVDPWNEVAESFESNNAVVGETIEVVRPELAGSLTLGGVGRLAAGSTGTATLRLSNAGEKTVTRRYNVHLYLSEDGVPSDFDSLIAARTLKLSVPAGQTSTVVLQYVLPKWLNRLGTYHVIAVADVPGQRLIEVSQTRAQAAVRVRVVGPQLVTAIRSVKRVAGRPGRWAVAVRIANTGTAAFDAMAKIRVSNAQSGRPELASTMQKLSLAAGGHVDLEFTVKRNAGDSLYASVSSAYGFFSTT